MINKSEVFDNAGCTGAVVATGTYPAPMITMQHIETVPDASIKYLTGTTGASPIDRITASSTAGNNLTYVGSGVTSSTVSAGATRTHIVYKNGSTDITTDALTTTSIQAAVLLGAGTFSTLAPINGSTTSFQEQDRFIAATASGQSSETPSPVISSGYNYAQHDGNYSCVKSGTTTTLTFAAKFSASNLTITFNGALAGFGSHTINGKVGFVSSRPYYSETTALTSNAETYFFFNNNLTIVAGPAADVPDLLAQRPTSVMNCSKTI